MAQERFLCFRQTRNMHESGFRYIEYGYITYDEAGKEEVEIAGRYDIVCRSLTRAVPYHIDLTKSGWFRILPRVNESIEWSYGGTIAITTPTNKGE